MSRHRDVRNYDYSDDYHGYDDVYGHSIDDDYYVSPSDAQYIYNRENSREQRELDIKEDADGEIEQAVSELTDEDKVKLNSSVEKITEILGSTYISRNEIIKVLLQFDFNIERSVNMLLEKSQAKDKVERKEKDLTYELGSLRVNFYHMKIESYAINHTPKDLKKPFVIPKLNLKPSSSEPSDKGKPKFFVPKLANNDESEKQKPKFFVPKLNCKNGEKPKSNFFIPKLNAGCSSHVKGEHESDISSKLANVVTEKEYDSLSELVENHLKFSASDFDKIKSSTKTFDIGRPSLGVKRNGFKHFNKSTSLPNGESSFNHLKQSSSASLIDCLRKEESFDTVDGATEENTWDIDLTSALKVTKSAPVFTKHKTNVEESFDIPFMDCESPDVNNFRNPLPCTLDASDILKVKILYSKTASPFGKSLRRNYKKKLKAHGSVKNVPLIKIKRFTFETLSPDDEIQKHVRR